MTIPNIATFDHGTYQCHLVAWSFPLKAFLPHEQCAVHAVEVVFVLAAKDFFKLNFKMLLQLINCSSHPRTPKKLRKSHTGATGILRPWGLPWAEIGGCPSRWISFLKRLPSVNRQIGSPKKGSNSWLSGPRIVGPPKAAAEGGPFSCGKDVEKKSRCECGDTKLGKFFFFEGRLVCQVFFPFFWWDS